MRSQRQHTRLSLELLETRDVPTVGSGLVANLPVVAELPPTPTTPTDVTALARQMQQDGVISAPSGPTVLYVNFDGWKSTPFSGNLSSIGAFQGTQAAEQDILYRLSETFAPFNVEVLQLTGDGNHSSAAGATTVFIGDYSGSGLTPSQDMDYPHGSDNSHGFNSNASDVTFVDANFISLSASHQQDQYIVAAAAHEAGHTFGLAHVRTDGVADYPNNTNAPAPSYNASLPVDVMSYDSNNDYFNNSTFNLTDANGNSVDTTLFPNYKGTNLLTQNSFTYLQTVLGARPSNSQVGVIDENISLRYASGPATLNLVDPGYYQSTASLHPQSIASFSTVSGTLQRAGDYAAYKLDLVNGSWPVGQLLSVAPNGPMPVNVLIYDETANDPQAGAVVAFGSNNQPASFTPIPSHTYYLVVGGASGQSGAFNLTVGTVKNVAGTRFTLHDAQQHVTGTLAITSQTGANFSGMYTPPGGQVIAITGQVGPQVSGPSTITFSGKVVSTLNDAEEGEQITTQTTRAVTFTGQVSQNAVVVGLHLSGQGNYTITQTVTTVTRVYHQPSQTTQTTKTLANLSIVSGSSTLVANEATTPLVSQTTLTTLATTTTNSTAGSSVASGQGAQAGMTPPTDNLRLKDEALSHLLDMADPLRGGSAVALWWSLKYGKHDLAIWDLNAPDSAEGRDAAEI